MITDCSGTNTAGCRLDGRIRWTTKTGALDEISRSAIGAIAMLGVGEVPEGLMRHVSDECVTQGSETNEVNVSFLRVVKGESVIWSSLLSEKGERGLSDCTYDNTACEV